MALTKEQIAKIRQDAGAAPLASTNTNTRSLSERLGFNATTTAPVTPTAEEKPMEVPSMLKGSIGYVKNVGEGAIEGAKKFGDGFNQVNESANDNTKSISDRLMGILKGSLGMASGGISTIFSPITGAVKSASDIPAGGGDNIGDKANKAINAKGGFVDIVSNSPKLQKFMVDHPDADTVVADLINVFGAVYGGKKAPEIKSAIVEGLDNAGNAMSTASEIIGPKLEAVKNKVIKTPAEKAAIDAKTIDDLTGTITQGKVDDLPKAKAALSSIDTTDVKNYSDLSSTLTEKINNLSTKLDQTLETNTTVKRLDELEVKTKVGDKTVSHNYVNDALKQLKELYSKTNDPTSLEAINQLATKAKEQGLTIKEINDLARQHSSEFKSKAFNKIGDPLTSVNAQAFENTRTGIKTTARDMFENPLYKEADGQISGLIKTRDLIDQTVEAVNKLKQRVSERGFGEKAGRLVFQVADTITGGGLKGFIQSFIPRSAGLKIMNALDLEAGLQKNLKTLRETLGKNASEADIITKLEQYLSDHAAGVGQ